MKTKARRLDPFILLFCALSWAVSMQLPVHGQDLPAPSKGEEAGFARTVRLTPGKTTIARTVAALSEQTGLKIEAADYLRGRTITVLMQDIPARDALTALAELNNLRWRKTDAGRYLLTRRRQPVIRTIDDLAQALQQSLPDDWQRFISTAPPAEPAEAQSSDPPVIANHPHVLAVHLSRRLSTKIQAAKTKEQAGIFDSLKPQILTGEPIRYASLNPQQQEHLVLALTFHALSQSSVLDRLRGRLMFYHRDPASSYLDYVWDDRAKQANRPGMLGINSELEGAPAIGSLTTGFSAGVWLPGSRPAQ